MGYDIRRREGPLTPLQNQVVLGVLSGQQQQEVAHELGTSPQYVSSELRIAAAKFGVTTTTAAAGRMATHLAYLEAAQLIEGHMGETAPDDHVNHVLAELVRILRERAAALLPQ